MLLPQKIHEPVVLFTGARGQRGGPRASQGVVLLTDWSTGNLSGRQTITNVVRNKKTCAGKKEIVRHLRGCSDKPNICQLAVMPNDITTTNSIKSGIDFFDPSNIPL